MVIDDAPDPTVDVTGLLRQAISALAPDPARAGRLASAVLMTAPDDPDALVVLGTALRVQGDFDRARAVLEPLARTESASWIVQFELAQALFALGDTRAAIGPLTRAVSLNPDLGAGWRLLGDILQFSGQLAAAQSAYDRRLRSVIGDRRLRDAASALAEGRLEWAERDLRSVVALQPTSVSAAHLLGEVVGRRSRLAEAEAILTRCLERAPELDLGRQSLALALLGGGKYAQALTHLDHLLARDPSDNRVRMIKAAVLTEIGDFAAAAEVTASLLAVFPDQPRGWLVHANGLRTLGRNDEAIAALRTCIELDPDCSEAYWSLANLKTYRFTGGARAAMEARVAEPDPDPEDRRNLHFALGKADEDLDRYEEAFDHYARANAIQRGRSAYDAGQTTALVQRSKALFTEAFFAQRAGWGSASRAPIFIVGLPRSGSTLVDQILSSHPAVESAGELGDKKVIADWIGGATPAQRLPGYPGRLADLPREACASFGDDYLEWTGVRRRLGRQRFTDKAPWNFLHIGLIHLIAPGAKIVDVRRHPMACCFSAFRQHFAQGSEFSNSLEDIGRYYVDYADLMAHFDRVLPGKVHRVIYETLVQDTELEVRRLLAYLDLPFDPACLRFFDNPRPVATPSSQQVRQPIFDTAIDQWRRFEPWLGPLRAVLGPLLDAYPATPAL
jgi:tetratricopeptide (TPR) repeat protein